VYKPDLSVLQFTVAQMYFFELLYCWDKWTIIIIIITIIIIAL